MFSTFLFSAYTAVNQRQATSRVSHFGLRGDRLHLSTRRAGGGNTREAKARNRPVEKRNTIERIQRIQKIQKIQLFKKIQKIQQFRQGVRRRHLATGGVSSHCRNTNTPLPSLHLHPPPPPVPSHTLRQANQTANAASRSQPPPLSRSRPTRLFRKKRHSTF